MNFEKIIWVLVFLLPLRIYGQLIDSDSLSVNHCSHVNYEFAWHQTILPVSLIGVGAVALAPGLMRDGSRDITNRVIDMRGNSKRLEFDNYLQYLPVAGSLMLGCIGVQARHSFKERAFILATSYAALAVLTNIPKFCIDEKKTGIYRTQFFPFWTYGNRIYGRGIGTNRIR